MEITNSCAPEEEVPRTNNQSKYIHYNSPGDIVYRQTANSRTINTPFYQTTAGLDMLCGHTQNQFVF